MANVTVLSGCVQGTPTIITLTGSTVVSLASAVNVVQVGAGYFYRGDVTVDSNFGNQASIDRLVLLGAII